MHPLLPENIRFSDVFRGYRKGALGKNGLKKNENVFNRHQKLGFLCNPKKLDKLRDVASVITQSVKAIVQATLLTWHDPRRSDFVYFQFTPCYYMCLLYSWSCYFWFYVDVKCMHVARWSYHQGKKHKNIFGLS